MSDDFAPATGSSPTTEDNKVNPQLQTLINEAKKTNAALNPPPTTDTPATESEVKTVLEGALAAIHIGERLIANKDSIMGLFRNHGMDSMSVQKAWDELMSILTLEG